MRVLVAGASGFLGLAAVKALAGAGHDVKGLARSFRGEASIRAVGGTPVRGDLLVPASLRRAVDRTDVVIHLAQASGTSMAERREVRVAGARALLGAMRAANCRRLLVGSGYWVYADNSGWIDEESAVDPRTISQINFETEQVARSEGTALGIESVVARPGMVYGDGSWFREMVDELRAGEYHYAGDGANFLSPIELDDAGRAFQCLVEEWPAGKTFLAVDDEPMPTREFAEQVAQLLQVPVPAGLPPDQLRLTWGEDLVALNLASRRASNRRLRGIGWRPLHPNAKGALAQILARMRS